MLDKIGRAARRHTTALQDLLRDAHVRPQVAEIVVGEREARFVLGVQGVAQGREGVVFAKVGCEGEGGLQAAYGVLRCGEGKGEMPPEVDSCELGVGCACFFAG